jgi:hypothetical protein
MTYAAFCKLVKARGWTVAQLRCDVPPTEELLALMDRLGLATYERYVAARALEDRYEVRKTFSPARASTAGGTTSSPTPSGTAWRTGP